MCGWVGTKPFRQLWHEAGKGTWVEKGLVGKVKCCDISKFNDPNTDADMFPP